MYMHLYILYIYMSVCVYDKCIRNIDSDGFKTIILLFQHSLQLMCVAPFSLSSIASTDCREYPR